MLEENEVSFAEPFRMFDDLPFSFMSMAVCQHFATIHEPMYYYRLQRPGQHVGA